MTTDDPAADFLKTEQNSIAEIEQEIFSPETAAESEIQNDHVDQTSGRDSKVKFAIEPVVIAKEEPETIKHWRTEFAERITKIQSAAMQKVVTS